jgi:hypothetical protein
MTHISPYRKKHYCLDSHLILYVLHRQGFDLCNIAVRNIGYNKYHIPYIWYLSPQYIVYIAGWKNDQLSAVFSLYYWENVFLIFASTIF